MEKSNRVWAMEKMLQQFPELFEQLWLKRGETINIEILKSGYLSSGQRLLVSAALNIWNGDIAKIDLEAVICDLDDKNFKSFIEAVLIARGWAGTKNSINVIAVGNG